MREEGKDKIIFPKQSFLAGFACQRLSCLFPRLGREVGKKGGREG